MERSTVSALLVTATREFVRLLASEQEAVTLCERLVEHAQRGAVGVGASVVLVGDDGQLEHAATTDSTITRVERVQLREGAGPLVDASATERIVASTDLGGESRWPGFAANAYALGYGAVIAVPLRAGRTSIGVLAVYEASTREWETEIVGLLHSLADLGAGALCRLAELRQHQQRAAQLRRALNSRPVLEQAKGMLSARHHVDPDTAFEVMRRFARMHNRKIHAVAREVVADPAHVAGVGR